ncbi:hypothetical protein CDL12_13746 [Handroanthus impetiginosus]|uniref:Uncharacterized protein n=1 Tax=Handroanthus impetiginosus TaxID=429701 RepID=A0A2G9H8J7_9LAMI|nr:hypothetical protein CDL12_13746 [Handroanthus impetiginosus]
MEGISRKSLALVVFIIFFSSLLLLNVESRVLNEKYDLHEVDSAIEKILDEMHVEAMKTGGPSHGGQGHGLTPGLTLGSIKRSGPSPGAGN